MNGLDARVAAWQLGVDPGHGWPKPSSAGAPLRRKEAGAKSQMRSADPHSARAQPALNKLVPFDYTVRGPQVTNGISA
jgi:hypothetical protein